MATHHHHLCKS